MLSRNLRRATSPQGFKELSFVASSISAATTITVPSETQAGDFIVFFDGARNNSTIPTRVTPSGYTKIHEQQLNAATDFNSIVWAKIATSGDASATITGMASDYPRKIVAVFRATSTITAFSALNVVGQGTTGTPTTQTKTGYTEADIPILVIACFASSSDLTADAKITVNGSTAYDVDIDSAGPKTRMSYLFFNDQSIYDAVVSMPDYSAQTMQSFYVTFTI